MTKAVLRKIYLAKRRELSADELRDGSERIANAFFGSFQLKGAEYLHSFLPIEKLGEVDTRIILQRIWEMYPYVQIVVPRVDFIENEILNLRFSPTTELSTSAWGIPEPTHNEFVEAEKIDMVLTPGLCFDRQGHRVGYGKGFYDRFLSKTRTDCVKIGLSHFEPIEKIEDAHDGDVAVDFVVTPDRAIATRGARDAETPR